jgi:hypothetical protein
MRTLPSNPPANKRDAPGHKKTGVKARTPLNKRRQRQVFSFRRQACFGPIGLVRVELALPLDAWHWLRWMVSERSAT